MMDSHTLDWSIAPGAFGLLGGVTPGGRGGSGQVGGGPGDRWRSMLPGLRFWFFPMVYYRLLESWDRAREKESEEQPSYFIAVTKQILPRRATGSDCRREVAAATSII